MAGESKEGLAAAVDALPEPERPRVGEVIGGDLFEPAVIAPRHTAAAQPSGHQKRGRPEGAKNKRSGDWIDYLYSRYPSVLEGLVAIAAMSPAELYRHLQEEARALVADLIENPAEGVSPVSPSAAEVKPGEIMAALERMLKIQISAMEKALPYLHERRGMVVSDGAGEDVPVLIIGQLQAGSLAGQGEGDMPLIDARPRNRRPQQNQELSEPEDGKSTGEKSTDDAK